MSNARGVPGGGMLKLRFDRYITTVILADCFPPSQDGVINNKRPVTAEGDFSLRYVTAFKCNDKIGYR